jgi:hypothetical protein
MTNHTFAVHGLAGRGLQINRAAADAAFSVPGVVAVGIDRAAGTLTLTSTRPVDVADRAAAIDEAGFGLADRQPVRQRRAS